MRLVVRNKTHVVGQGDDHLADFSVDVELEMVQAGGFFLEHNLVHVLQGDKSMYMFYILPRQCSLGEMKS